MKENNAKRRPTERDEKMPPASKILGLDYGTKRIGLAVAERTTRLAIPRGVIATNGALSEIASLCRKETFDAIVIGLPLTLRGEEGAMARRVRDFGEKLLRKTNLPLFFIDERMTSRGARKVGARSVDAAAAAAILQLWLDRNEVPSQRR
jgi:putative Holliday junction resolvase